jgi:hypothetical protein
MITYLLVGLSHSQSNKDPANSRVAAEPIEMATKYDAQKLAEAIRRPGQSNIEISKYWI